LLICVEWSKAGGIAGRGVLIDYFAYAKRHNIQYQIPGRWAITPKDIEAVAKEQNLELRYGDILLVRTGYVDWHNNASHEERLKGTSFHEYPGVEASPECVEWFWDHHFAAVAADSPAFETVPPIDPHWSIHPRLASLMFSASQLLAGVLGYSNWRILGFGRVVEIV
jgi:kynurenine formamidase